MWRWVWLALGLVLATGSPSGIAGPSASKRIAFVIDSWYPNSHADVIGSRFLSGYRAGDRTFASPVTVASVYAEAPRPTDQTRTLAARFGFRVAGSVAEALLDDPRSTRPRLAVDGVLIATREDLREAGVLPSPTPRLRVVREVLKIFEQTGVRVPIFIDKMLAANLGDGQAIVAEAGRMGVPLMAGSVLPHTPLDRPVRFARIETGIAIAAGPYWAYAHHAAELLQGLMEQRATLETGITGIREVGRGSWSMPDRERWGGSAFDALLASARRRTGRVQAIPEGLGSDSYVVLIQYADGARAVLALVPRVFDEAEFLLGAQHADGTVSTGGVILQGPPFDHFGHLVHALVEFYSSGRAVVPVERTLLTTGIVILGAEARRAGGAVASPALAVSYAVPRRSP
jgi:hypothetical protein